MTESTWITISQAAEKVGRQPVTVRRWAREGLIDAAMTGGAWLVDSADVLRYAKEGGPRRLLGIGDDTAGALNQAWKRVSRDLERDDLPDIIEHRDFEFNLREEIQRLADEVDGGYVPRQVRLLEMPKSALLSRPLAELTVEDRVVYEAAVQTMAKTIDGLLPDEAVFDHRLRRKPTAKMMTRHFSRAFADFQEYSSSKAWMSTGATICLKSDIAAFYEYVDHDVLLAALEDLPDHLQGAVDVLRRLFAAWRMEHRVIGLPQGPRDASGLLAHAYLAPMDSVCLGAALAYARFSDDIRVFFADRAAALRFMPRLVQAMRQLGLNLAAAKTEIVPAMQLASDFESDRRAAAAYGVENQMVDSLDELREIFKAAVADPTNVNQSDFTFALWRLGLIEDDYALPWLVANLGAVPFAANIVADHLSRLGYRESVSRAVSSYLMSASNVHPWTEVQFLRLLGTFDEVDPQMLEFIRHRISGPVGILGDFAVRVLGEVGTAADRRELRRLAHRTDESPQRRRAAIIAAACGEATDRSWATTLIKESSPPAVLRAARYVASGVPMPATFVRRRTPQWVPGFRGETGAGREARVAICVAAPSAYTERLRPSELAPITARS